MAKAKKKEENKVDEAQSETQVQTEPLVETAQAPSPAALPELERQLFHQKQLLNLRDAMISHGIDSISKLDAVLSQVNQRVKVLS